MTTNLDIANRALQAMGSRTNMTLAEFNAQTSNEAIQAQLIMFQLRDELNRMAPWDCATRWVPLTYLSTLPGNPENPTAGAPLWQRGLPPQPWSYEYQYPVDCLRARAIIPQYTTQAGGVPIYPTGTVTGAGQTGWSGPALKFVVATDQLIGATAVSIVSGGVNYVPGDFIVLTQPVLTLAQNSAPIGQPPNFTNYIMNAGAPAILEVISVGGGGVITSVEIQNQVQGSATPIGGSYFAVPPNPIHQSVVLVGGTALPDIGTGASFNLSFVGSVQRVILCNQTQAILCYNSQITDPNVMDPLFQDAWVHILAARLTFQLTGDKALANLQISLANNAIMEARKADGNEGITVNDVTPDFLRTRGGFGVGPNWEYSPNMNFDWGSYYSPY
jgi:hypothetical protein